MRHFKIFLPVFITVGTVLFIWSNSFSIDLYTIKIAGPPRVTEEGILFTYRDEKYSPKYVMVSGDFDNWRTSHMMIKNENGIFIYLFNETKEKGVILQEGKYRYRYLVDGIWISDPLNDKTVYDRSGTELSYFEIKTPLILVMKNPIDMGKNNYIFYYQDDRAKRVNIVGEFNNWNPYSHPMKKNKSGLWEIVIDIQPGRYAYRFIIDGEYKKDPLGVKVAYDRFNNEFSLLELP